MRAVAALDLLTLPIRPWRLANVVAALPPWAGIPAGVAGISLCLGVLVAGGVGAGEPYRDMTDYALSWISSSLFAAAMIFWFFACIIAAAAGLGVIVWQGLGLPRPRLSPVVWARLAAVLLSPLCGLVPLCIVSISLAVSSVPHPSFGMAGGKPAWVHWSGFEALGNPLWLLPLLAALIALATWQCTRIPALVAAGRAPQPPRCHRCGYPREGLTDAASCPECGTAPEAD